MTKPQARPWKAHAPLALLIVPFAVVLFRTAWLSDDAYISYRVIYNFLHGFGLRYNTVERVQVFTHPLWLILLTPFHAITGEPYYSSLFLSIIISCGAVAVIVFGTARNTLAAAFAVLILILSRSFMDFSTSGLENPLTHLILAAFALLFFQGAHTPRRLFALALLAGLGVTNRMDTLLLFLPALAFAFIRARSWKALGALALGFLPFILWELFATFYFGFPFPNTAYAKLGAGIPRTEMLGQGMLYLWDSLRTDPLTLCTCVAALIASLVAAFKSREWRPLCLTGGMMLYILYTIWVGGDFMSGRFVSAPLFVAVIASTSMQLPTNKYAWAAAFAVCLILGFIAPHATILTGKTYALFEAEKKDPFVNGVMNSRRAYYGTTGLLRAWDPACDEMHIAGKDVQNVHQDRPILIFAAGFQPYLAGPDVYYYDLVCLADPLRARLPKVASTQWHPGHIFRALPRGYLDSITTGDNKLHDKQLGAYYGHLCTLTRGPLFSGARLKTILLMNLGRYNHLIDYEGYRNPAKPGAVSDPLGRPLQELPQLPKKT